jgi:hypothetical protein
MLGHCITTVPIWQVGRPPGTSFLVPRQRNKAATMQNFTTERHAPHEREPLAFDLPSLWPNSQTPGAHRAAAWLIDGCGWT